MEKQNTPESGSENQSKDIARLNDLLRRNAIGGRVLVTQGVQELSQSERSQLMTAIAIFNNFTPDNDPYGEHDFGEVMVHGIKYFWKIDYYDQNYEGMSPNPLDQEETRRVMTVMRADEY